MGKRSIRKSLVLKKKQFYIEHKNEFCRCCFLLTSKLVKSVVFSFSLKNLSMQWEMGFGIVLDMCDIWKLRVLRWSPLLFVTGFTSCCSPLTVVVGWFHCWGSHSSCLVFSALVYEYRKQKKHGLKFSPLYLHFLRVHSPVS